MKKYIAILTILFSLLFIRNLVIAKNTEPSKKVDICHKNNGNGWTSNNVNDDSIDGSGNGDHNQNDHQEGQDIIPPFYDDGHTGTWTARNWDATGQAIFNNGCAEAVATATPIPTNTPTNTPTTEPTATPTTEPTTTPTITPEPTEEPKPTETPKTNTETSTPSTNNTPSHSCPFEVGKVDALNVETGIPNDNAIELYWTPIASADKVNIYYGEEQSNPKHSVIGVEDNGHFQVGGLVNGQHYWFSIEGTAGADCTGPRSIEIDPLP